MKKYWLFGLIILMLLSFGTSSCSYQGYDVNDTWRPPKHQKIDFTKPKKRPRGSR